VFEGRIGAVDEALIADGRLQRLRSVQDVALHKRPAGSDPGAADRVRRDPQILTDLLLQAL